MVALAVYSLRPNYQPGEKAIYPTTGDSQYFRGSSVSHRCAYTAQAGGTANTYRTKPPQRTKDYQPAARLIARGDTILSAIDAGYDSTACYYSSNARGSFHTSLEFANYYTRDPMSLVYADSSMRWSPHYGTFAYTDFARNHFTYTPANNIADIPWYDDSASGMNKAAHFVYSYNAQGKIMELLYQHDSTLPATSWQDYDRRYFVWSAHGQLLPDSAFNYDNNTWHPGEKLFYTYYNSSTAVPATIGYAWPDGNGVYSTDIIVTNTYYLNGRLKTTLTRYTAPAAKNTATLQLFPNPAGDILNIITEPGTSPVRICITNGNGQTVLQQALSSGSSQQHISVAHLPAGIYQVQIVAGDKLCVDQFIKL